MHTTATFSSNMAESGLNPALPVYKRQV